MNPSIFPNPKDCTTASRSELFIHTLAVMFICTPIGKRPKPHESVARSRARACQPSASERVVDLVRPKRNERMPSGRRDGEKNREKARRIPTARAPPRVIARTARRGPIVARFASRETPRFYPRGSPPPRRAGAARRANATRRHATRARTKPKRFDARRRRASSPVVVETSSSRPRSTADRFAGCGFFAPKRRVVTRQTRWDTKRKASGRRASGTHRESHDERARESEDADRITRDDR